MTIDTTSEATAETRNVVPRREVIGAWFLLGGVTCLLFGQMWDGQWHVDVGPDTFFTAPHLLLYASTAIIGLTCLIVVLLTSFGADRSVGAERSVGADRADTQTSTVRVLGVFRAPWPFLIGGLGAAGNLIYGVADLWWHDLYGFDIAVAQTPSHTAMGWTWLVEVVAMVMALGALRGTRSGRWGFALAIAVGLMAGSAPGGSIVALALGWFPGFSTEGIAFGAMVACGFGLILAVTKSARWMVAAGAVFVGLQALIAGFSLVATHWYADAIGQPIRQYALGVPIVLFQPPATFALVAFVGAAIVWWAVRRGWSSVVLLPVLGALAGLAMSAFFVLSNAEVSAVRTLPVAMMLGAGMGWFGWLLGGMLARSGMTRPSDRGAIA